MGKVFIFLANGHEEIEALTVVDILRRASIDIETVSIEATKEITSAHKITLFADKLFSEIDFSEADMLVLPGGMPGTKNLENYVPLMEKVEEFANAGKNIAAICAAPTILGKKGILKGKRACCYLNMESDLLDAIVEYNNVSVDGNIITSRGMGTAIDFSLAIVEKLIDKETADKISKAIVYK